MTRSGGGAHARRIGGVSLVVVAVIVAFPLRYAQLPLEEGLLAPLFALAIPGYSFIPACEIGWLGSRTMRLLGGASFSIYALQQPIFLVLVSLCARLGIAWSPVTFGAATLLLVILGSFAFQYVEEPLRRRILASIRPAVA